MVETWGPLTQFFFTCLLNGEGQGINCMGLLLMENGVRIRMRSRTRFKSSLKRDSLGTMLARFGWIMLGLTLFRIQTTFCSLVIFFKMRLGQRFAVVTTQRALARTGSILVS